MSHGSPPVNGFLADEDPKSVLDLIEKLPASREGGDDVDEPVPEALTWQYKCRGEVEAKAGATGVDDGVDTVDRRWQLIMGLMLAYRNPKTI